MFKRFSMIHGAYLFCLFLDNMNRKTMESVLDDNDPLIIESKVSETKRAKSPSILVARANQIQNDVQIVMDEEELDFSKNCCMFGSEQHKKFIKNRIETCKDSEKDLYEKQLNVLEETDKDEYTHATYELFGKLPNLRVIRHPRVGVIHPLRVQQYIYQDILHREEEERKTSWMELFFDLIFAGVISQLSHSLQHHFDSLGIWEFFIKFVMIWRVWSLQVLSMNRFFSRDLIPKIYLLIVAAIAIGLSLNLGDYHISAMFIAFYLINELVHLLNVLVFSIAQPLFFKDLTINNFITTLMTIPAISALFFEGYYTRNILLTVNILLTLYCNMPANFVLTSIFKPKHKIALNIEHWSERFGLFTIIVLGESVLAILTSNFGYSYPTSVLGMIVVASIQWIYFDVDSAKQYLHAVRRSRYTGVMWFMLQMPLHCSIAFSGACLGMLVVDLDKSNKYTNLAQSAYIFSLGLVLLFMGLINMTHKSLDDTESRVLNIPKRMRLMFRFCVSAVLIVIASALDPYAISVIVVVGLCALLFFFMVIVEEWGGKTKVNC
eukprot:NODE_47_length_27404_cov_0.284270.p4 type:complete len:550 gc:universal NODE_47_length_27404_cov_0.284270:24111-25760(+)